MSLFIDQTLLTALTSLHLLEQRVHVLIGRLEVALLRRQQTLLALDSIISGDLMNCSRAVAHESGLLDVFGSTGTDLKGWLFEGIAGREFQV